MIDSQWNLYNIPPIGHPDVAEFVAQLWNISKDERDRLGKPHDFLYNYALYRGHGNRQMVGRKGYSPQQQKTQTIVNLYFANIERTVSNITARVPTGEVVDLDGSQDDAENVLTIQLKKWWKDTNQQIKTRLTARVMEIYGITVEKPVRNPATNQPDIMITDPFAFFPAPENWENIAEEAPYICYVYSDYVDEIQKMYSVTDIAEEDVYDLLGQCREDFKPSYFMHRHTIGNYAEPMAIIPKQGKNVSDKKLAQGIIIEVWLRDNREVVESIEKVALDDNNNPITNEKGEQIIVGASVKRKVCPDGIRKITISKSKDPKKNGWVVLDDSPNPNINYKHLQFSYDISSTYPWGRLPVYTVNSYKDGVSVWGFAAAEQVGDLIAKINLIVSKLIAYVINVMTPPLIVQQHCGITREMIESSIQKAGRLILMPSVPNARIEFMSIPNLPATFFEVLDLIVKFFDRIYQIEDADRGKGPKGVIAASAIVALQERNQVLMQTKSSCIDTLAEERSKWAIGLWQNWGIEEEHVDINGERMNFRMVDYVGRKFNYVIESGSSTPRTSLQLQEMAKWLYENKAIGQRGLLENLNWPNWKEEIARTAESQLDQALMILIDSGLPEEYAIQLKKMLQEIQLQNDENKKASTGGKQPTQPKSLVPSQSNVQPGM